MASNVAKVDDDVFVNVPLLVGALLDERNRIRSKFGSDEWAQAFIMGHVIDSAAPVRDRKSKWYTPETLFPDEFYPPYVSGTAYAMTMAVARRLVREVGGNGPMRYLLSCMGRRMV